ncbi:MAG: hypothetical protein AAF718_09135 [Pseudomonadota bacterium]
MPTYPIPLSATTLLRMGSADITLPPLWLGALRLAGRVILIAVAVYGIHLMMDWATTKAESNDALMVGVLTALLLAYALLIAVPFMPGVEIGISLLLLKGASIAPFVYGATLLGLCFAYVAGRFLPHSWLHALLADLRLKRACALVDRLAPMSREDRLAHLGQHVPRWLAPLIGPWRYLLLAALINLPGNTLVGGGGGIAFTSGFSRLFQPGWTVLTIAFAVAPVPLTVWLWGRNFAF